RFRNTSEAFDLEGSIEIETPSSNEIVIIRKNKTNKITATLKANLSTKTFQISENERNILI
ncbi:sucrose phosphorylase, partial [Listeria monocytogenes]|nr:sucrose phosphorylase [Listeria monocytogenes]EBF6195488.1 sucrose phosphorylase [Listeria monocytogenes]HAK1147989.1 sucrose phosphorylase [Listeria monocytogenes]